MLWPTTDEKQLKARNVWFTVMGGSVPGHWTPYHRAEQHSKKDTSEISFLTSQQAESRRKDHFGS